MAKRIYIMSETFGSGDEELGRVLMRNFMHSLARTEPRPAAVMMANTGVRLACEGSEVLDDLGMLAQNGVMVGACGTCLDHLGLGEKLAVGGVGTMPQGVEAMLGDDEIVTIA